MKKISIYLLSLLTLTLGACKGDYKDWAEPLSNEQDADVILNASIAQAQDVDLNTYEQDMVQVFVPTLSVTPDDANYTTYYSVEFYDTDTVKTYRTIVSDDAQMAAVDLQDVVKAIYGNKEATPRELLVHVTAVVTLESGEAMRQDLGWTKLTVTPIPQAKPTLWYLIGGCIGDGTWTNTDSTNVGTSLIPMYPTDPENFNTLEYAGYFPENGAFKIIKTPGSWDDQYGYSGGELVKNVGNSSDITVSEGAGYYRLTLDLGLNTLTITKLEDTYSVYTSMWIVNTRTQATIRKITGGTEMTAMAAVNENHDWMADNVELEELDDTSKWLIKFFGDKKLSNNWGGTTFPMGGGTKDNITYEPGTYKHVYFNDILGAYYFIY